MKIRSRVVPQLAASVLALAILPASGHAQNRSPALKDISHESPAGLVEIIGLRQWTLQMLRDSVQAYRPGTELHDEACAVVLRDKLGFRDALVLSQTLVESPNSKPQKFVSIKMVEPAESGRVRWLDTAKADSFRVLRPDYAPLILGVTDANGNFSMSRLLFPLQFGGDSAALAASIARRPAGLRTMVEADVARLHTFQRAHADTTAWRTAIKAIREDGEFSNRVVPVVVLANFGGQDSTWYALIDALRDGNETVRQTAENVLQSLPARKIVWTPAVPGLRALLGGTNVHATEVVFRALTRSGVSPTLAGPLLGGNTEWVLAYLRARNPKSSSDARVFLVQLNGGKDLGQDVEAWEHWLNTLRAPTR